MFHRSRTVSFINARVITPSGTASSIRFGDRVIALDEQPQAGEEICDLDGAYVLPGLVNAHDHLELNHYGRLKCRERYENATAWIDDLRPALRNDPRIRANSAYPLRDRLFIGGLKNLLAGVTTVAHHNPVYRELNGRFPVRVVRAFGWAHSFALEGQPVGAGGEMGKSVAEQCRSTPADVPFIVHAAEGVDEAAAAEITRLETLGCLGPGTVLVHGVALTETTWSKVLAAGASLVWCPGSNLFLFGRTVAARALLAAAPDAWTHVCLGSDSRVTGSRDLLDEMRAAHAAEPVTTAELLRMVTTASARVLKLRHAGQIAVGLPADLLVIPDVDRTAADALLNTTRAEIQCVVIGGRPAIGHRRFAGVFAARHIAPQLIAVDDRERLAAAGLARAIAQCPIHEPGVTSFS